MRLTLLALILLSLTACNPKVLRCDPTIIKVPVPTPAPVPPEVVRPSLNLSNDSTTNDGKARDLATTIEVLKSYTLELEGYLDSYRTKAIENNKNLEKKVD